MNASDIVIKLVVSVCAILLTMYVIPYLRTKVLDSKWQKVLDIVEELVLAAEQIMKEPGSGEEKKKMVMEFTSKWLKERGIEISEEELDKLVEAAVRKMNERYEY